MFEPLSDWIGFALGGDAQHRFAYISNGKHMAWYASVRYTLIAAAGGALLAVVFGVFGAALKNSRFLPARLLGGFYTVLARGVPDVLFLLFIPLACEQLAEYFFAQSACTATELSMNAQWPPCSAAQWYLSSAEHLLLACVALGFVYGAFVASVIHGALRSVSTAQLEAARAYGFSRRDVFWRFQMRQMWAYALPGLSNIWMLLFKATSLLSLLQIADIVQWAERLGAPNFIARVGLIHVDWRWRYYLVLLLFYILVAVFSEWVFNKLQARASRGILREPDVWAY